ncbi:MAG: CarboxypepD reg-like domain [Pyrinomonadaceae bacterium]|nr:CarboxypepD reg-like domain [Pyrinomonadaceae bacterium]
MVAAPPRATTIGLFGWCPLSDRLTELRVPKSKKRKLQMRVETKNLVFGKVTLAINICVLMLTCGVIASAQSGRSGMRGYVAFSDLSYNDVAERKVHALIELRRSAADKNRVATKTDEHGSFDLGSVSPGEYTLRISSPGYRVYETEIYLPSDFIGNLAVMLKKQKP